MYHLVYKTTNLNNNKIYIGKHSTPNLNDGYIGSGTALLRAINKHGKENFKCEILRFCDTELDAYTLEAELVTTEFCERDDTYNLTVGGERFSWLNKGRPDQAEVMRRAKPWTYRTPETQTGVKNHRYGKAAINRKVVVAIRGCETVIKESIKEMGAFLGIGRAAVRWGLQGRSKNRDGWLLKEISI